MIDLLKILVKNKIIAVMIICLFLNSCVSKTRLYSYDQEKSKFTKEYVLLEENCYYSAKLSAHEYYFNANKEDSIFHIIKIKKIVEEKSKIKKYHHIMCDVDIYKYKFNIRPKTENDIKKLSNYCISEINKFSGILCIFEDMELEKIMMNNY